MKYALLLTGFIALLFNAGPALSRPWDDDRRHHAADARRLHQATVAVDPVLAKLNTLEDQLEAMTAKLNGLGRARSAQRGPLRRLREPGRPDDPAPVPVS